MPIRIPDGLRMVRTERKTTALRSRSRIKSGTLASLALCFIVLGRPGGFCGETEPDPIPNSAVKLSCADGTKPQGLEE
jgi:hypothetical protein